MKYKIIFPNEEYSDFSILEQNEKHTKLYKRVNNTTDFYGDYDVGIEFTPNEYYSGTQRFENEVLNFKFKKFNFGSIGFFGNNKNPSNLNINIFKEDKIKMLDKDITDLKHFSILPTLKETRISTYLNNKSFTELKKIVFSDKSCELNIHFKISSIENLYYFIEVIKNVGPLKLQSNKYHFKFIQNKLNFINQKEDFKKLPELFFDNTDLKGKGIEFFWRILF